MPAPLPPAWCVSVPTRAANSIILEECNSALIGDAHRDVPGMLHEFLSSNRSVLIERCRAMAASRSEPQATAREFAHGIPVFLSQLIETLALEHPIRASAAPIPAGDAALSGTAALHGRDLFDEGLPIGQVVRDYGDVCQAVTNLAFETGTPISINEFRTFNRCLDNAIAGAVSEYARYTPESQEDGLHILNARLGPLAHELRNYLPTATLVVSAIKAGNVGISGATAAILDRSLMGMRNLIDRSLAEVRLTAGLQPRLQNIHLATFLSEVEAAASLDARARDCRFSVGAVADEVYVSGDPELLAAAVGNLMHNASSRSGIPRCGFARSPPRIESSSRLRTAVAAFQKGLPKRCCNHSFRAVQIGPVSDSGSISAAAASKPSAGR
jgi:hypothetical protein